MAASMSVPVSLVGDVEGLEQARALWVAAGASEVDELVRNQIQRVLAITGRNVPAAARILGNMHSSLRSCLMRALTGAALVTLALARTSFATDLAAVLDSYVERPAADSAITMLLALPSLSGTEAEAGRFLVANDLDEMGLDETAAMLFRSLATSTVSRCSSSVGPAYHGIASVRSTTWSPLSAETGIVCVSCRPRREESSARSRTISSNRSSE